MRIPVRPAPPGHTIPVRRAQVLQFCKDQVALGNPFPTPIAIAVHMGWASSTSAMNALALLAFYDKAIRCHPTPYKRVYGLLEGP